MEISKQSRARWLWLLVAVTAVYGMVNVFMFYTTASFGATWFAASLVVYGVLLVSALALLLLDTDEEPVEVEIEAPVSVADTEPQPDPQPPERQSRGTELLDHEVVYEVPTGRVLEATVRTDGVERSLLLAITSDEVLRIEEIEARLDGVDIDPPPIDRISDVDEALERRSDRPRDPTVGDDRLAVEILDHEVLHALPSGDLIEVTFQVEGTEHTDRFAITDDEVLPIHELDADLEGLERSPIPEQTLGEVEAALRARRAPDDTRTRDADTLTEAIER